MRPANQAKAAAARDTSCDRKTNGNDDFCGIDTYCANLLMTYEDHEHTPFWILVDFVGCT